MSRRILSTLLFLMLGVVPSISFSTTLPVPGEYATIQAGINAAAVGDTVLLDSGLYYGDGNREIDFLGKDIVVRSRDDDPATCIITCQGSFMNQHRGVVFQSGESSAARLEGVTVSDAFLYTHDFTGAGITCLNGSSPTISNCRIVNCYSRYNGAAFMSEGSSPTLIDCWIDNNTSQSSFPGVLAMSGGVLTMIDCLVTGNRCLDDVTGAVALGADYTYLYGCTIADNGGIGLEAGGPATLNRCTIVGNDIGVIATYSDPVLTDPVQFEHCLIAFNIDGFDDEYGIPVELSCCNVFGNENGDWTRAVIDQRGTKGNISEHPMLCDPDNWDYRPAPGSPCLEGICGQIGAWGEGDCAAMSGTAEVPVPADRLLGNYPNPFNPSTKISFELSSELPVTLSIVDVSGRLVRNLLSGNTMTAGLQEVEWSGRDSAGRRVGAGIYFSVLVTPRGRDVKRMALIK